MPPRTPPIPLRPLGVWLFGARGGLATTVVTGARAMARGLSGSQGLLTETDLCRGLELAPVAKLVFGGHEVRNGTLAQSAAEIHERSGTLSPELVKPLRADLKKVDRATKRGCLTNAGKTITSLSDPDRHDREPLRAQLDRITRDMLAFLKANRLQRMVCVNLTSTEPKLEIGKAHQSLRELDRAIDANRTSQVRPSTLYAYAAASLGLPYVHFTPSNSALVPAVRELFERNGAPYVGCDGKTGETLVKSALAPMFKYRNLKVLTWQGYNILGDRDGAVLSQPENKQSKVATKDALLPQILGYPLHTHVGIDYVPSLHDWKTAWDFVHFEGFLGTRMSMQFTWQGNDSILAAPLVLDLVRLADLAQRTGVRGPLHQLACFFKQPIGTGEHDLHRQWHMLVRWLEETRAAQPR